MTIASLGKRQRGFVGVLRGTFSPEDEGSTLAVIYHDERRALTIEVDDRPRGPLLALFQRTVWGADGARFQDEKIEASVARLTRPSFLTLAQHGEVVGGYCFSEREVLVGGRSYPAVYRTFLSIDASRAGRGWGSLLVDVAKGYFERRKSEFFLSYGFVEGRNTGALRALSKGGYKVAGAFEPVVFSRLRPRSTHRMERLRPDERESLLRKLCLVYRDHALVRFDTIGAADNYFVTRTLGRIVCGVQAHTASLRMRHLNGFLVGTLLRPLLAPLFRNPSRPASWRFLALEGFYCEEGHEEDLLALLEGLLREFQVKYAVAFLDRRSPVYRTLKESGRLGWINAVQSSQPIYVMTAFHPPIPAKGNPFNQRRPLYISAFDVV